MKNSPLEDFAEKPFKRHDYPYGNDRAIKDTHWFNKARCALAVPDIFHGMYIKSTGENAVVRKLCRECSVLEDCLTDALHEGDVVHGYRGGLTANGRRTLIKQEQAKLNDQ